MAVICVPIMDRGYEGAMKKIARANHLADMIELRLDSMKSFCLEEMLRAALRPVIVTHRSKEEGGHGSADPETRARYLLKAVELGSGFIDVEYSMPAPFRERLLQCRGETRVILSEHIPGNTPSRGELESTLERLVAAGADIVKIVTRARAPQDNLRVLGLIPRALEAGCGIIAFCMGPQGRMSRIVSPLMGGYLTFAALSKGEESADGQIPVMEMTKAMEVLSKWF